MKKEKEKEIDKKRKNKRDQSQMQTIKSTVYYVWQQQQKIKLLHPTIADCKRIFPLTNIYRNRKIIFIA